MPQGGGRLRNPKLLPEELRRTRRRKDRTYSLARMLSQGGRFLTSADAPPNFVGCEPPQ